MDPNETESRVRTADRIAVLYATVDQDARRAVSERLAASGHVDVHTRDDVDGVVERLSDPSTHVDCVLTGHDPPRLDAHDVIAAVADHEQEPPVVVATATGDERLAGAVLADGASGYVPLRPDADETEASDEGLRSQVERLVRNHRSRSGLELYRSLVEDAVAAAEVGILIRDESGRIIWINRTLERYLGVSGSCLLDRRLPAVVTDELADSLESPEAFLDAIREGPPIDDLDCRFRGSGDGSGDAEERVLEYHERSVASGAFAGGRIGLFYDVTAQRERERDLERYETMVETVVDGVYTLDADYNYSFVNEALAEMTGYAREEIIGSDASLLIDEETMQAADERREELLEDPEQVMTAEYELYTADGEPIPIEVRFRPLPFDENGEFRGTTGVIRDVSERKERERELHRQNERLDSFASVVSHDLREPLRMVRNYLGLLERRYGDELDDDADDFIEYAADGAERMQAMIDDLLTLAKKGRVVGETTTVDLETIVRSAWGNIDTADATLVVEDSLGRVEADNTRLLEVFENLFGNCIEHGGHSARVRVGTFERGFFVADDGPGIPPEDRGGVFDFRQTTDGDNVGLGLAIVQEVVEAHGWTITAEESASGGARFEVTTDLEL